MAFAEEEFVDFMVRRMSTLDECTLQSLQRVTRELSQCANEAALVGALASTSNTLLQCVLGAPDARLATLQELGELH